MAEETWRRVVTSRDDLRPCPPPEILHRFNEGRLGRASAADVAEHVETCRECRFIIGETSAFLREEAELEEPTEPSVSGRRRLAYAAAALLAVIALWLFQAPSPETIFDRTLHRTPIRVGEARLSGVPYADYRERRGDEPPSAPRLHALGNAILTRKPTTAAEWHRRGIVNLLNRDNKPAIAAIERATRLDPENALYWNDLAAARLTDSSSSPERNSTLLRRATADALKALSIDADSNEARFNLALAYERHGRIREALSAYDAYLAADPRSAWAAEVRSRRANLSR